MSKTDEEFSTLLDERNELASELTQCHMALGVLANIYDAFLEAKGDAWCRHWECVPLNQLRSDGVMFKIPTLEDCRKAKIAAEGEPAEY